MNHQHTLDGTRPFAFGCIVAGTLAAAAMSAGAAPPTTTESKTAHGDAVVRTRSVGGTSEADAQRVAEGLRQHGMTIAKAIELAEAQLKGQAVEVHCASTSRRSGATDGPMSLDVTVVDASGRVMVATVDVATGKIASTRAATGDPMSASDEHHGIIKGSEFRGRDVVNAMNRKIGDITELAIDEARGRVAYAIVDLDDSSRVIAVPWSSLHHDEKVCRIDLRGPRDIDTAPAFEPSAWPRMNTDEFGQPIAEFYGTPLYGRDMSLPTGTPFTLIKLSDVIGMNIQSPTGEALGEIEDLVIDPDSGRISYAALSFGGFLGFNDKLFAVPWDALSARKDGKVVFAVTKERLKDAPGFDKKNWPATANPSFERNVRDFYRKRTAGANE